ncbi:hypothetical protein BAJUN_00220 [Bajunvirus bajun]|uniref:Uncharacterized protein n=1 Tax=Brevundimonas phage vB_BgoS-Bajun TaxID=2948594 RepID=A0A9E7N720_9CAUD|nr:hypothetical protein BAJUN_00220 [Brevundimonas phage vB_BgoS-Bajun]
MPRYRLRAAEVDAIRFNGERVDTLPAWAQQHSATGPMGEQVIARDAVGQLLVPTSEGTTTCRWGDYLVHQPAHDDQPGKVFVVAGKDFEQGYEQIEEPDALEAIAEATAAEVNAEAATQAPPLT